MFNWVADAVTAICVATIFAVVVANFLQAEPGRSFRERRSPVATLSMAAFFVLLYVTIRLRWGMVAESGFVIGRSIGLALVVVGTAFNVWGRLHLGANWADHVRIYANQTLVTGGPYRVVRHPLYASLLFLTWGFYLKHPANPELLLALSASLFLILAAIMVVTRKVDWYQLSSSTAVRPS